MLWPAGLSQGSQGLTICSLCWWWTVASSSAWRLCCFHNWARSRAGSLQSSSRATEFFSLSHVATWTYAEDHARLPRALPFPQTSGLPQEGGSPQSGSFPTTTTHTATQGEPRRNPAGKSAAAGSLLAGGDGSRLALPGPLSCQKERLMGPEAPSLEPLQGRVRTLPVATALLWTSTPGVGGSPSSLVPVGLNCVPPHS